MSASEAGAQQGGSSGGDAAQRRDRRLFRGQVTSNKMQKTLVVEVRRKVRHPLYEKYVSKRTYFS